MTAATDGLGEASSTVHRRFTVARLVAPLLWALTVGACGGTVSGGELPHATLGLTPKAEQAFRPLMRRWVLGTPDDRLGLEGKLVAFEGEHPRDPLLRLSRVLRAFNALQQGELERAEKLVREGEPVRQSPLDGPAGTTRDLGTLVLGSVERRRGQFEAALGHLAPLLNKMLDDFATVMLDEELSLAALGAKRYGDALLYMEAWREVVDPGHEQENERRIKELLAEIPARELMAALDRRTATRRLQGNLDLARLIAQQLAIVVVHDQDAVLARELLTKYGALLGIYGEAVARLAVVETKGRVLARTVGVLLALGSPGLRRRSADVVAGMTFGLGLPGSDARLVSREADATPESVQRAMNELAGDGAAVVVAGLDPAQIPTLERFAEDNSLPVLLLTEAGRGRPETSNFVFSLATPEQETMGRLERGLRERGASRLGAIGEPLGDDRRKALGFVLERSCFPSPSATDLVALGLDAVVLYDGATCGEEVSQAAAGARLGVAFGLGAEPPEVPARSLRLAAGIFPVDGSSPDPRLKDWLGTARPLPNWWTALGRDAAALAWGAVKNLAETTTEDAEVKARRVEATSALVAARASLWTTSAEGFAGGQVLKRPVTLLGGP